MVLFLSVEIYQKEMPAGVQAAVVPAVHAGAVVNERLIMKNMMLYLLAAGLFLLTIYTCDHSSLKSDKIQIIINEGWRFHQQGEDNWYPASVPGCVHTDLHKNRIIDDPFFKSNEDSVQWIENKSWIYENEFKVDDQILSMDQAALNFKGLDTYTDIFLNDSLILQTYNMFRQWRVLCKDLLKPGINKITVKFRSSAVEDSGKASRLSYKLPENRVFTRKAPYHYGWDWGPRFVTMGIWREVVLEAWQDAVIEDFQIYQNKITDSTAFMTARFTIESSHARKINITLINEGSGFVLKDSMVSVNQGKNKIKMDFKIDNPELWWCRGLGEQNLYTLSVEMKIGNKIMDTAFRRIGIRSLRIIEKKDSAGSSFQVVLNGVPVFMKGANYIPQDSFLPEITEERYKKMIQSVADANMNMLRVWGGGIYEDDFFYDICDEMGILIWQDFMFACAMYPGDAAFVKNVQKEAVQNIKRLRNHACIALWCGNNEVDEAWHNWGWQKQLSYSREDSAEIWHNYLRIFHEVLPAAVNKFDAGRFYLPSSPKFGWGHEESLKQGDCHYWGVWWGREPFSVYEKKVGRFMSEYGFQGIPSIKTVKQFTDSAGMDLNSESMQTHQKHPFGYELIDEYMRRDYQVPKDFNFYIYISQLLQRDGIIKAIESHRRAKPYCMGTLYWQLNDCWPVVSWASVDYYGRWKALHYGVRRAYKDVLVSPVIENNFVKVYVVSDLLSGLKGDLEMRLLTFSGDCIWEKSFCTEIEKNSSKVCFKITADKLFKGYDKTRLVFTCILNRQGKSAAESNLFFVSPKDLNLPVPVITKSIERIENGYSIELNSNCFAKDVFLSVSDCEGFFTENYFDLLPGKKIKVDFLYKEKIAGFEDKLNILSLADIK